MRPLCVLWEGVLNKKNKCYKNLKINIWLIIAKRYKKNDHFKIIIVKPANKNYLSMSSYNISYYTPSSTLLT